MGSQKIPSFSRPMERLTPSDERLTEMAEVASTGIVNAAGPSAASAEPVELGEPSGLVALGAASEPPKGDESKEASLTESVEEGAKVPPVVRIK